MSLEHLIVQFGYPALVIGLLLEGETTLILGAFLAHRGYLNLPLVIFIGAVVAFASDQFFFWLGRAQGSQFLAKRPTWQSHVERARGLLAKNTNLLFLTVRFMYGLRTVLPFLIGMSGLGSKKFVVLDLLGAFLWAFAFGLAGHFIGQLMNVLLKDVKGYEFPIVMFIVLIGIGIWLYRRYNKDHNDLSIPKWKDA